VNNEMAEREAAQPLRSDVIRLFSSDAVNNEMAEREAALARSRKRAQRARSEPQASVVQ
jgi:hypothetical protein